MRASLRTYAVALSAAVAVGVFAAVVYYLFGQYRGQPLSVVIAAVVWALLVLAPLHHVRPMQATWFALALSWTVSFLLSAYWGQLTVKHLRTELIPTLLFVTTLPVVSATTSLVYKAMMRAVCDDGTGG